jgi:hypothetical protein
VVTTVVNHVELVGLERLQSPGQPFEPRGGHGNTWTKGFTSTASKTPSVT